MRFDVKLYIKISDVAMLWFVAAHVVFLWFTLWGTKASLQNRALMAERIPKDIWSAPLSDLALWVLAIVACYLSLFLSFVNAVAPGMVLSQWLKTKGWPLPGLWMGLFFAIYMNVWLNWFFKDLLAR